MIASYSVIDGDIMAGFYNKMKATAQVIPKGNGSILKWFLEFEKANEEVPDPYVIMEFVIKTLHDIDAYLLNAQKYEFSISMKDVETSHFYYNCPLNYDQ